jgi:hypothetical protein
MAPKAFLDTHIPEGPFVALGDGTEAYADLLAARGARIATGSQALPHAGNVARLALARYEAQADPAHFAPDALSAVYLRRPEAEKSAQGPKPAPEPA